MNAAPAFCLFTSAIASVSVPGVSALGGFLKPIWLSLICTKLRLRPAAGVAASAGLIRRERGTPPATVQSTPAPAHTMHSSTPRRLLVCWPSSAGSGAARWSRSSVMVGSVCRGPGMQTGARRALFSSLYEFPTERRAERRQRGAHEAQHRGRGHDVAVVTTERAPGLFGRDCYTSTPQKIGKLDLASPFSRLRYAAGRANWPHITLGTSS